MVAAAASTGATAVSVIPFTALNTIASGQPVQQYTMGYVLTGGTWKQFNSNAAAGYAYPRFIYLSGNNTCINPETNESAQNGQDALYLNNVNASWFTGFNNNTGSYNGYCVNMVNSCQRIHCSEGVMGGGTSGIINIDATSGAGSWAITFTGLDFRTSPVASGPDISIAGEVVEIAVVGNVFDHGNSTYPVINDASTDSTDRGCTYSGNAINRIPSALTTPIVLSRTIPGRYGSPGTAGCPTSNRTSLPSPTPPP